ncbi:hypothetical protein BaRGS_00034320 [Batillaria attramentaria]|uniref:Helicase domino n=1 Tax=Batillaria attramentaria TaxID=370345 RepID=A0ABD0JJ25_9CAEN
MQRSDGSQQQEAGGVPSGPINPAAPTTQPTVAQMRVAGRPAVVSAQGQGQAAIGMIPVGQQGMITTAAGFTLAPQPAIVSTGVRPAVAAVAAPQAMVVSSQTVSRLLSPPHTLQTSTVQLPATLNVLQRQLSAPGVVGLSTVSAQDLQQVLQQVSQQSITLLTADPTTTVASNQQQQRPRLARPLSFPHSASPSPSLPGPATSSVSATGGTIHHHGQSPVRGGLPLVAATLSHSNLQQSILSMNLNQQQQLAAQRRVVTTATTTTTMTVLPATAVVTSQTSRTVSEVRAGATPGLSFRSTTTQPPRKKIKVEEKAPATPEINNYRKMIVDVKHKEMLDIKANYFENLTEVFFLQNGLNLMDYHTWKKRPTPQLVNFLKSGNLDSDEEEDILQVKEINSEVKVLTNPGSNVPLATPVAISTTLPPMVSALSQQGTSALPAPSSHRTNISHALAPAPAPSTSASDMAAIQLFLRQLTAYVKGSEHKAASRPMCLPGFSHSLSAAFSGIVVAPSGQTVSAGAAGGTSTSALSHASLPSSSTASSATSQLQLQLAQGQDAKAAAVKGQLSPSKQHKSPPLSPSQRLNTRQQSLSAVYDNLSGGSQEVIVERARQEAQVMQRVAELRREGLWSSRRLPRVQEPPRQKAHWDYLLEEMTWLAADFVQERKWKKAAARKLARMVNNYFKEQEQKELRAEKEEAIKLKKIASHMAKMVKEFWTNIEKVVQFKQQTRLEEKKKKALDLHLNFIVDQTEKYSTWLTEGLKGSSVGGSLSTSPAHSSDGGEFEPSDNTTDDEETIEKEEKEAAVDEGETKQELEDLQKDGELPLEELLKMLPEEVLTAPASLPPSDDEDEVSADEDKEESKEKVESEENMEEASDKEFAGTEEEAVDEEDTIAEQEKHEKRNYKDELQDLQAEGEMSIEDLAAKYAGAYDSDFEMPKDSSSEEEEESDSDSDDFEIETDQPEEEPGLEVLVKPSGDASSTASAPQKTEAQSEEKERDPSRDEIADIAEQAQSLQPKGYTLETTEVKTKVPFLLKHSLREYQHVGLDWLATMHEKRLNGILADEMGLGKTIQTIALLAHLACEKSIWGPHLIVVPTSVMLNWEMELKKWCPAFKILTYYGNQKERKLKRQGWTKTNAFHVCITSYKLVVQDHQAFRRKKWKYLILDEAQNIKNFKSQRWQMLLNFSSQRRLLLTGTPLQNSLMELWSLMHFLMPNVFQSHRDFKEWFSNPLTGMIEGSQEYNESLIKRLHKVLRPFLLRRLKNEVEKQMPKKFEHVVMCRLSKRQRFLYDDFMSQAKTKETLAAGHYMSVINILMQLRKVCNHPNLFDPRPIVSPFRMEGLVYNTASIVTRALEYDPFEHVDMRALFPNLAEMERDLPAFVSHRVKQLRTANNLIEELDSQPDPPPRPPPGQLKPVAFRSISPAFAQNSGRASPVSLLPQARSGSPVDAAKAAQLSVRAPTPQAAVKMAVAPQTVPSSSTPQLPASLPAAVVAPATATLSQVRTSGGQTLLLTSQARAGGTGSALILSSVGQTVPTLTMATAASAVTTTAATSTATPVHTTLQAKVMPQQLQGTLQGTSSSASVLTSQPITVQIQQTEQGTRLMIPTGQLSQLPASLFQIVQTPSGQQLIATSSAAQVSTVVPLQTAVTTTASSTVNGPSAPTTVAASSTLALVTTAVSHVKTIPALSTQALAAAVPSSSVVAISTATTASPASVASKPVMRVSPMVAATSAGAVTTTTTSVTGSIVSTASSLLGENRSMSGGSKRRREKLRRLARINSSHCAQTPVYGPDVHQALTFTADVGRQTSRGDHWLSQDHNRNHPHYFWHETSRLASMIHTPDQYLEEMKDILDRFVFAIPSVISPGLQLRVGHPDPSQAVKDGRLAHAVRQQLRPLTTKLNTVQTKATIQFPELRLIQYDCGKLQTLDVLLRQLKMGHHRVLIFTQMTKMLDVLEAFLNYHGHRYLRLDGTTRVEQRQALMDRFNADKRIFCFILSTRSGGIGVNLTGADTVVFYDSDWNPTMDAQAQDRCHRIGQTRDVHIYRLISEMTVEENILKKANQKRLLGDLAIEGGNFTTAFFKEPSGLKALADQQQQRAQNKVEVVERELREDEKMEVDEQEKEVKEETAGGKKPAKPDKDANLLAAFEQALCKAEDETDAIAATLVKAEQKAELAEFDESIPWDEREAEARKEEEEMSRAEMELAMLDKELTPIERYAVGLVESQMEDEVAEELKMAEEDIQNSKKDWELARLKALKEEEERRAEMEDDEMLYTYLRDEAQVKRRLAKTGKVKKGPGRPTARSPASPSASSSDAGSVEAKRARISSRVALRKQVLQISRRGRARQRSGEESLGESEGSVVVVKRRGRVAARGRGRGVRGGKLARVENGDGAETVAAAKPQVVKRTAPLVRIRKNNIAVKKVIDLNGSATPEEVKAVEKLVKKRVVDREPILMKLNAEVENGEDISKGKPRGRGGRKPKQPVTSVSRQVVGQPQPMARPARPILNVPTMASPPQNTVILGSPPRNKSPVAITSPVSSPTSSVPPPWSNPNLVIRTRRASIHSPVAVSGTQVIQGVQALTQQQTTGVVQSPIGIVHQPSAVVQPSVSVVQQSAGMVRLISPSGPLVALAASQPGTQAVQMVSAARVRPGTAVSMGGTQLSLAGARVVATAPQLVNTAGLSGSIVRMPDGSTAVLGQISGGNLIGSQQATNPTIIVSAAGQMAMGARAILATNLNRARVATPRAAVAQPQVVSAAGVRTVQLGTGIGAPLTLRGVGVGGVPVGVNLMKAGTSGVQIPIVGGQGLTLRGGQIIQTNIGQTATPQSFVLITPRMRTPNPASAPTHTPTPTTTPAPTPQDVSGSAVSEKKGAG